MNDKKAVVIVSHGSRSAEARSEFERIVTHVQVQAGYALVRGAYMEITQPDIPTVIREVAAAGFREVVVVPYFLFMGNHIKHDIPEILNGLKPLYPEMTITLVNPIGFDPLMADILIRRIEETDRS